MHNTHMGITTTILGASGYSGSWQATTWDDLRPVEEGEQSEKGHDENEHPDIPQPA